MLPKKLQDQMNRRMFVAASAALLGGVAGMSGSAVAADEAVQHPAKTNVGPRILWPQHSASTPFVNAADFGLKPLPILDYDGMSYDK